MSTEKRTNSEAIPPQSSLLSNMVLEPYQIEVISSENDVLKIREDWDRLSASASHPNVFATFDWYEAWVQSFMQRVGAEKLKRNVLLLRKGDAICGIAPLTCAVVSKFGFNLRRLQFAGREHEWDYNDLSVGEDLKGRTEALVEHLGRTRQDWELLDLQDVRDTDNAIECIQSAASKAGLSTALLPTEERCPYMPIDCDWTEYLNHRSSATRHSFRNRESKLRRIAGDALRMRIVDTPHSEPDLLERMVSLEAQKRSGGALSVPFLGRHKDVFEKIFTQLGPKGWICVALLEWGDRLLSWHLLFRCGSKLWGYMTAYDHEFEKFSPGSMLIPAIMDYAFANGVNEYDFLSGEESYKMQWAKGFHRRYRILIWNDRWKSQLYARLFRKMRAGNTLNARDRERIDTISPDHSGSAKTGAGHAKEGVRV